MTDRIRNRLLIALAGDRQVAINCRSTGTMLVDEGALIVNCEFDVPEPPRPTQCFSPMTLEGGEFVASYDPVTGHVTFSPMPDDDEEYGI